MRKGLLLALAALLPVACKTLSRHPKPAARPTVERLEPARWPAIEDELDPAAFVRAGERSVAYLRKKENEFYRLGDLRVGPQRFIDTIEELGRILEKKPDKPEKGT